MGTFNYNRACRFQFKVHFFFLGALEKYIFILYVTNTLVFFKYFVVI